MDDQNVPPQNDASFSFLSTARLFIVGTVVTLLVLGLSLIVWIIGRSGESQKKEEPENVLAESNNECVTCHKRNTPGIVEQYGRSDKAAAGVTCQDCHEVPEEYPGAIAHHDTHILSTPTSKMCQKCHEKEVAQFNQSRHGLPAYVAMWGTEKLSKQHRKMYEQIPEAGDNPKTARNALFKKEGRKITKFACERCHNIGKPYPDGSVGQCQKCHLRHRFDLKQARKPETCNACHIGPDHPQFEIYENSPHGIAYHTQGEHWNWGKKGGTLTTKDFPAPTCATCHISGFGGSSTTHDVGDRLTWYLFAPISKRRPAWQDNRTRMQNVCSSCHNRNFIKTFYSEADQLTEKVNDLVREGQQLVQPLREKGLLTEEKFDEPVEYEMFELWHHWGRTTKFGAWMQGPDYTQWHGAYEVHKSLSHLRKMVKEIKEEAKGEGKKGKEEDNKK